MSGFGAQLSPVIIDFELASCQELLGGRGEAYKISKIRRANSCDAEEIVLITEDGTDLGFREDLAKCAPACVLVERHDWDRQQPTGQISDDPFIAIGGHYCDEIMLLRGQE